MIKMNKQINLTGVSSVIDEGKETQVAVMSATIPVAGGMPQINKGIQNKELFVAHRDEITADFTSFEAKAYEIMSKEVE